MAWGNGQFAVVGRGVILTSPDGVTWTPHDSGVFETYDTGITWGNDQFLVVTQGGAILISSNGVAWTRIDEPVSRSLSGITWSGSQFVAVGTGTILTSPDGAQWTLREAGTPHLISSVAWGNGQFVAISINKILTSPDGITWTTRDSGVSVPPPLFGSVELRGVTWGDGRFVAVGEGDTILTSPDGLTWTIQESKVGIPGSSRLESVAWGNGQFVAVGDGGAILTSPDGVTWTRRETETSASFAHIAWGNGQFIVTVYYDDSSSSGWVLTSTDGVIWTRRELGIPIVNFVGVTWGNNQFLVSGSRGILISPNGATWTLYDAGGGFADIAWGNNQFVAVGSSGISRSLCAASVAPSKIGVFRNGDWLLDRNGNGEWEGCSQEGGQDLCISFQPFNRSNGWPVVGDWESGIQSAVGLFRARAGRWFLDRNNNQAWDGCGIDRCYAGFGRAGHRPVTGDWNGAGVTRIGVFRGGEWYLDANGNGRWDGCSPNDVDQCPTLGQSGDLPVVGDWTGAGITQIGVFRDGQWRLDANGNGQWDGCPPDGSDECPIFGRRGDLPITGDWNGVGIARIGVFRDGEWYLDANGNGQWDGCSQDGGQDACFN
ncbi:MAG: hypothetical protein KDJ31_02130, partial [Candidatus Competibacteraceae bacterium]|nr:hypothetical protein [Candidatus Competibacteraceae bacterium]